MSAVLSFINLLLTRLHNDAASQLHRIATRLRANLYFGSILSPSETRNNAIGAKTVFRAPLYLSNILQPWHSICMYYCLQRRGSLTSYSRDCSRTNGRTNGLVHLLPILPPPPMPFGHLHNPWINEDTIDDVCPTQTGSRESCKASIKFLRLARGGQFVSRKVAKIA